MKWEPLKDGWSEVGLLSEGGAEGKQPDRASWEGWKSANSQMVKATSKTISLQSSASLLNVLLHEIPAALLRKNHCFGESRFTGISLCWISVQVHIPDAPAAAIRDCHTITGKHIKCESWRCFMALLAFWYVFESSPVFKVPWDESLLRTEATHFISSHSVQFSALTAPQGCLACLFQFQRLR